MSDDLADSIDLELLQLLSRDGRATYSEMASRVGLSVAAVKRRVDRLQSVGVITGFTVEIDRTKLGWTVETFTEVRYSGSADSDEMIQVMKGVEEVESVYTIAGDPDILVKINARDHGHLQQVINRLRRGGQAIGTKSMIVLSSWHRGS
ncbi:Lrp/AsnC family transcriptional regulator [Rhodococcus koreensis]